MNDHVNNLYEQGLMQQLTPQQLSAMSEDERLAYQL